MTQTITLPFISSTVTLYAMWLHASSVKDWADGAQGYLISPPLAKVYLTSNPEAKVYEV